MYKYAFVLPLIVLMYFVVNTAKAKNESDLSLITSANFKADEGKFQVIKGMDSHVKTATKYVVKTAKAKKESDVSQIKINEFKAYEGYYKLQVRPGVESHIKILTKNNQLVLSEQWSGKEIVFEQKSELEFFNKSENFPLVFTKSNGAITQVLAFNRDLWNKDNDFKPKSKVAVKLTSDMIKAFEGYYQLSNNKEMMAKMVASKNDLVVQTLWNNAESTYSPESDLTFFLKSGDNGVTIKFKKENGIITSGTDFMGRIWNKIDNYVPRKEIQLSAKQLQAYQGEYTFEFKPGKTETINITAQNGNLILKENWSGNEITFVAESDVDFFSKQRPFPLKFTKDADGNITHVLAFQKDLWTKVK
jgi:hypothetical protein